MIFSKLIGKKWGERRFAKPFIYKFSKITEDAFLSVVTLKCGTESLTMSSLLPTCRSARAIYMWAASNNNERGGFFYLILLLKMSKTVIEVGNLHMVCQIVLGKSPRTQT